MLIVPPHLSGTKTSSYLNLSGIYNKRTKNKVVDLICTRHSDPYAEDSRRIKSAEG